MYIYSPKDTRMFITAQVIVAKHWNTVEWVFYSRDYFMMMRMNKYSRITLGTLSRAYS